MAISPKARAEVQGMIVQGVDSLTIAKKTKVSRASIYNIRKELEDDTENNRIHELGKASPAILTEVVNGIKARSPKALEAEVGKLLDAAESLQRLELSFHATFDSVLQQANTLLSSEKLSVVEWQIITSTLATAFKDIYNSKGTTINVAQAGNVSNGNSLSMFQGRM